MRSGRRLAFLLRQRSLPSSRSSRARLAGPT